MKRMNNCHFPVLVQAFPCVVNGASKKRDEWLRIVIEYTERNPVVWFNFQTFISRRIVFLGDERI